MASAKPVIACEGQGIGEVIQHGRMAGSSRLMAYQKWPTRCVSFCARPIYELASELMRANHPRRFYTVRSGTPPVRSLPRRRKIMTAANPSVLSSTPSLVDLAESDLPEIAAFVAEQSGQAGDAVLDRLTWLLLENPARHKLVPLGCGVRSTSGALVGCILYLPQVFTFGSNPILLLGSTCFYVNEFHRGFGGALFLKFTRIAQQWPIFGNSANAIAAQLWKARCATPIAHSDHELLGVVNWPPVVEEVIARRVASNRLARAVGAATACLRHVRNLRLPRDPESCLVRCPRSKK